MKRISVFLLLVIFIFMISLQEAPAAEMDEIDRLGIEEFKKSVKASVTGLDNFDSHREGLFVKRYTREELREEIEKQGGRFFSNDELIEQLKYSGLIEEKQAKSEKKDVSIVNLGEFSFHKKGHFHFVRYSADGKSLYVSYMYPTKNRDAKDYIPHIFDRNALVRWNTTSGRLEEAWLAEENNACAVDISRDEKIAIYHVDIYEKSKDKGIEVLKNQLYSYDLKKEGGDLEKIVSYGDKEGSQAYRNLDNIALSPDGKLIVFSGQQNNYPDYGWGHQYIVNMADKKVIKKFKLPYGKDAPAATKAASMVFSPDGKRLARSFPDKVDGIAAKIAIQIMDTASWEVVRNLPAAESSLLRFYDAIYSPDSKYLIKDRREIISADTGSRFCSISNINGLWNNISPDGKFYLVFLPEQFNTFFLDTRTCFRLPGQRFPRSVGKLKSAFSPDGLHIVLAGETNGANAILIIDFNTPNEHQIDIFRNAQRAIELYKVGLKKEAVQMARETIASDPKGLYESDYGKRLKEASMPLFLSGEFYRSVYEQLSRQKVNRLGVSWNDSKEGIEIIKINQNTPAQRAGLTVGDIITGIGGEKVATVTDFMRIYDELPQDRSTQIEIVRNKNPIRINITPIKGYPWQTFNVLMEFAQTGLEAGHPAIAMQAVNLIKGWMREGSIYTNRGMQEQLLVVEASALAAMGKEDDAFALLIRHNGFETYGNATLVMHSQKEAFSILLKNRLKLAVAMMVDEKRFPEAPEKTSPPQPYPDLSGKIIKPLTAPPTLQPPKITDAATIPAPTLQTLPDRPAAATSPAKPALKGTVLD